MGRAVSVLAASVVFLAGSVQLCRGEEVFHHGLSVNPRGDFEDCVACHDGLIAKDVPYCTQNCSFKTAHSLQRPYPPPGQESSYQPPAVLRAEGVELVRGTVVCISCHNLRNPAPHHLVVDIDGSRLCYVCHIK
ncbi:MAG: cytochrome C [Desulfuromonadales bacterium]|nr:MAG: cytochrome C [Desulfuromonadales bacterium]